VSRRTRREAAAEIPVEDEVVEQVEHHSVMPVWQTVQGVRFCSAYIAHGNEWVVWPCDAA
jgi:hypothetical protein